MRELPAAIEAPAAVIIPLAQQGWSGFLEQHPYDLVNKEIFPTLNSYHDNYLSEKNEAINALLEDPDSIIEPTDLDDQIKALKTAISLHEKTIPEQFCDYSYLDFLAERKGTIEHQGREKDPYHFYLELQKSFIENLPKQNSSTIEGTAPHPQFQVQQESIIKPNDREQKLRNKRMVIYTAMGLVIIAGVFTAHKLGMFNGMLGIVQNDLTHPTPALADEMLSTTPASSEQIPAYMSPEPTQSTPEIPPTSVGSGEGGNDDPPKLIHIPLNENSPDWNKDSTPFDVFGLRPSDGGSATLLSNGETLLTKAGAIGKPAGAETANEDNTTIPLGVVVYRNFQGQNALLFLPINTDMQEGFEEISVTKDKQNGAPGAAVAYKLNGEQKIVRYSSSQFIQIVSGGAKWEELQAKNPSLANWIKDLKSAAEKGTLYYPYGVDSGPAKVKIPGT
jgi:hypothetical protein